MKHDTFLKALFPSNIMSLDDDDILVQETTGSGSLSIYTICSIKKVDQGGCTVGEGQRITIQRYTKENKTLFNVSVNQGNQSHY